jgi:uncharacterized protein YndB with AHSA1/START domain
MRNYTVAFTRAHGNLMSNQEFALMADCIVKTVELKVSVARVWRAQSDHNEFGQWFRVKLDGPFEAGVVSTGKMTYPGHENHPWLAVVECIAHERVLSFRWVHSDKKSRSDISEQPTALVDFRLEPILAGTRLIISESGFEALPNHYERTRGAREPVLRSTELFGRGTPVSGAGVEALERCD